MMCQCDQCSCVSYVNARVVGSYPPCSHALLRCHSCWSHSQSFLTVPILSLTFSILEPFGHGWLIGMRRINSDIDAVDSQLPQLVNQSLSTMTSIGADIVAISIVSKVSLWLRVSFVFIIHYLFP
jgi:hypothetical protein